MKNILVVDDNKEITDLIEQLLLQESISVTKAYSGKEALSLFHDQFSLVILDVMMPEMDGYEVCLEIRKTSTVPVLYLSAKGTDIDKVIGLSAGGDDYMVKPFSNIELIARVKALIRRYSFFQKQTVSATTKNTIQIDTLTIDTNARIVTRYDQEVRLTRTEYDILFLLSSHPGRIFSTEEIFCNVWGEKYYEGNNTVMVHLARLREKIEDNPRDAKIIKNVWGVGYRIDA